MKNALLNWSKLMLMLLALLGLAGTQGCKKDDDTNNNPVVEDGIYVKGAGTAFADFNTKALFKVTKNEILQTDRAALMELYIPVKAGTAGFNIVKVAGTTRTVYGPGADFKKLADTELDVDEPKAGLWKGTLTVSSTPFTVPEDGLYHVVIDVELNKVSIARANWGIIGGATPGGWSTNTPMNTTFDLNKMVFTATDVLMLKNDYKFRYSDGWKIILDANLDLGGGKKGVKVNTNLGGSLAAPDAGGANISNTVYGIYKFVLTYELGKGFTITAEKTADGPPLAEYPEKLYMIGDGVDTWDWTVTDLPMVPVHSHPELFWKIVECKATGGFKFAPGKEWKGDFGITGTATNGVYQKGSDNVPVPGTAGLYLVVVDLKNNTVEVTPAAVYFIGDCVGGYDPAKPENILDVTATTVEKTRTFSAGDLRLHVAASTLKCDWWQAEFMVLNGKIEYRGTGNDQTRVNLTAGMHSVVLDFKTNTGSIN